MKKNKYIAIMVLHNIRLRHNIKVIEVRSESISSAKQLVLKEIEKKEYEESYGVKPIELIELYEVSDSLEINNCEIYGEDEKCVEVWPRFRWDEME